MSETSFLVGPDNGDGRRRPRWSMFAAINYPNFLLLVFGLVFADFGASISQLAFGWLIYDLSSSPFLLGLSGLLSGLAVFLFSFPGGALADLINRRKLLIGLEIAIIGLSLIVASVVMSGSSQVWNIILFAVALAIVAAVQGPARLAFVADLVPREATMNAISYMSIPLTLAKAFGQALGGFMVGLVGVVGCFLFSSVAGAATLVMLLLMHLKPGPADEGFKLGSPRLEKEFRDHSMNPLLFVLMALGTVPGLFGWSYSVLLPVVARDVLMVGAQGLGTMMFAMGFGSLIGALTIICLGDFRFKGALALVSACSLGIALVLFAWSSWIPLSLFLVVAVAMLGTMLTGMIYTLLLLEAPDLTRGLVTGLFLSFSALAVALGNLGAGVLANVTGAPATITIGGLLTIFFTGALAVFAPGIRRL